MKRWYDKSISFACTSCGKCCTSKNKVKVFINHNEINQISNYLKISTEQFISYYTDLMYDDSSKKEDHHPEEVLRYITLKSKVNDVNHHQQQRQQPEQQNRCIFLSSSSSSSSSENDNKCSIYEVRPTQCRTYPYWPQHMIGRAEWLSESLNCEGMKVIDEHNDSSSIGISSDLNKLNQLIDEDEDKDNVYKDDVDNNDDDDNDINNKINKMNDISNITDAVTMNNNEIMLNLIIHHIHNRGDSDDNWTYDQAKILLQESC